MEQEFKDVIKNKLDVDVEMTDLITDKIESLDFMDLVFEFEEKYSIELDLDTGGLNDQLTFEDFYMVIHNEVSK